MNLHNDIKDAKGQVIRQHDADNYVSIVPVHFVKGMLRYMQ